MLTVSYGKNPELIKAVNLLMEFVPLDIVDHWEADLNAIGIASKNNHRVLAYIATTDKLEKFNVHLELPCNTDIDDYVESAVYEEITLTEMAGVISGHFRTNT